MYITSDVTCAQCSCPVLLFYTCGGERTEHDIKYICLLEREMDLHSQRKDGICGVSGCANRTLCFGMICASRAYSV